MSRPARFPDIRPILVERLRNDLLDHGFTPDEAEQMVREVMKMADDLKRKTDSL